jgi:hypothetical protein
LIKLLFFVVLGWASRQDVWSAGVSQNHMGARDIPALVQDAAFLQLKRVPFGMWHALIFTRLGDCPRP